MNTELWPPLSVIRNAFETGAPPCPTRPRGVATVAMPGAAPGHAASRTGADARAARPAAPLTELARRREAVAQRAFTARWAPGRLVSVLHEGRLLGVLLDRCIQGDLWQGWMAAGEADWAGAFDVLLEPDDEPFEPAFGSDPGLERADARTQPAAVRARARRGLGHAARGDPRGARRMGRAEGAAHRARARPHRAAHRGRRVLGAFRHAARRAGPARRLPGAVPHRRPAAGLGADAVGQGGARCARFPVPARPAAGAARGRLVGQHPPLVRRRWMDAARVRGARPVRGRAERRPARRAWIARGRRALSQRAHRARCARGGAANLVVRWKDGVRIDEADRLLRTMSAEVVGGPGTNGVWRLHVDDPVGGLSLLAASPLVESAGPASERP
jgi:hypothetical protein